ncbi:unnamed protein product [Penicillium camemberti]|uniref:Str. FM013 n=1 Tax=Penicillium camemberti (strain FM 013) TaxID=1429867 RepID=A0A0G4P5B7_PENC3|nr:unnamed protein product [Penicillium camemberti]
MSTYLHIPPSLSILPSLSAYRQLPNQVDGATSRLKIPSHLHCSLGDSCFSHFHKSPLTTDRPLSVPSARETPKSMFSIS